MDKYQTLGMTSQVVTATSVVPYVRGIIHGVVVPNRISWGIWAIVGCLLWFTIWTNPASNHITIMFASILAINPSIIFVMALLKGSTEPIRKMEKLALCIAVLAMVLWLYQRNSPGLLPTLLAILADVCALILTIQFVMQAPDQDRPGAWGCFIIGSILTIFGTQRWNTANLILPVYMTLGSIFVIIPLMCYRIRKQIPLREWIGYQRSLMAPLFYSA